MLAAADPEDRVQLYRALSDAGRLRTLALLSHEELTVSELSAVMGASQPQVSKRTGALRQLGLVDERRQGARTYLRTSPATREDPVLQDAIAAGTALCRADGSWFAIPKVVAAREATGLAFFERTAPDDPLPLGHDHRSAHLFALAPLLGPRKLAVDVGCGDGETLETLAPLYDRVVGVERSRARLAQAALRLQRKALAHVSLIQGSYDDVQVIERVDGLGRADLVFASLVLHHAARPAEAVRAYRRLLKPGGRLVIVDYLPHDDDNMREQGDIWLGFAPHELTDIVRSAGLSVCTAQQVPPEFIEGDQNAHLGWQTVIAEAH